MKSLRESLFDKDLITKDIYFGQLYNVDEWGDDEDCERTLECIIDSQKMNKCFKSSKWKKFIRWSPPRDWKPRNYEYSEIFFAFTHIIMSCSSKEEITTKINEFVNECLVETDFLHKNQYKIQTDIFTAHEDIRMFLIQLISNNYPNERFTCWMTVKKK